MQNNFANNMYNQVSNRSVRDLVWVVCSSPLVSSNVIQSYAIQMEEETFLNDMCAELQQWFLQLDKNPEPLSQWLQHCFKHGNASRLGIYFEYLISFWIRECLMHNFFKDHVRVMNQKQVLGEFDFLFNLKHNLSLVHWEVAVKFYLLHDVGNGKTGNGDAVICDNKSEQIWVGPNGQDRLDIKLARLGDHQLPLSEHPLGKETLKSFGFDSVNSKAFLKGYLFYPADDNWRQFDAPVNYLHPAHLRGWWTKMPDPFLSQHNEYSKYVVLQRLEWLSPYRCSDANEILVRLKSHNALRSELTTHFLNSQRAVLVAEVIEDTQGNWREISRGFIVDKKWPELVYKRK